MEDRFEATFVIDAPPDEVWQRLLTARPLGGASSPDAPHRWLPAFEGSATDIAIEPGKQLRVVKDTMPCKGTEIVVVLEAAGSGTRVTVVQSGFGARFQAALDSLTVGWEHIVADLCLYLERGIRGGRHLRPWAGLGLVLKHVDAGLLVADVAPGSFAARSGMARGDVLVTLGGAPMTNQREFLTITRVFGSGQELAATWARGSELIRATATI